MTTPAVRVDDVSKAYGRSWALRGVSTTVAPGEFVALLGANGAGKSTLLRICAGLARPLRGRVEIDGADLWKELGRRRHVGFLSHAIGLYPSFGVRENLLHFARLGGISDPRWRVDEIVGMLELGGQSGSRVGQLSRGWQQRVAIARSLLAESRLLLWDEPFAGLDDEASALVVSVLDRHRSAGGTAVLSTHDAARVNRLCNRALVLDRGRIAFDGPAAGVERGCVPEDGRP